MKKLITLSIILLAVLAGAYYLSSYLAPRAELNALGEFYLRNSYFGEHSAGSPEVVTAILWDYRGLDTYFETAVLFMAIISAVSIFRNMPSVSFHPRGFTNITKTGVKIVGLITFVAAATTAFHGHITPGGGFQGGATIAGAGILFLVAFGIKAAKEKINKNLYSALEGVGGLIFLGAAMLGLSVAFFYNTLWHNGPLFNGKPGTLLSAGFLPIMNLGVGLKVFTGLVSAVFMLSLFRRWKE